MVSPSKVKWFVSFLLAVLVLVLGLKGGSWGSTYAANNTVDLAPSITRIEPAGVPVGSPYIVMVITGAGFEINKNPRIRLTSPGADVILDKPLFVLPDAISQLIPENYFSEPTIFDLSVVQSSAHTIPVIPVDPDYDEVSNIVKFTVYEPDLIFIPLINKQ